LKRTTERKLTMTHQHFWRLLALAGLGSVTATAALAQDGGYFYGGLGIGQSRANIDDNRIAAGLLGSGLTMTSISRDEKDTGYKLFGGYQFNRYFGVEAGYFRLGEFGFNATTTPAGTLDGRIKLQGLNLDLVATLPVTEKLSFLARVGAQQAKASDRFSGTGSVVVLDPNPSERKTNAKYGLGMQYAFSPDFLVRGEAERYRVNDAVGNRGDVNLFSVSLVFPFGRAPAATPRPMAQAPYVAPPPPVMAPPPPPPPVVVAPPPPPPPVVVPERRRVSFEADSLFGFDQTTVRPEGRAKLDAFASEVKGTSFEVITVEGHTDRLGSTAYNQALSQRRAEVVKAYLVSAGGIDGGKITAVGKGETMPLTKADECKGTRASPALILCLQPDRRVEVEVTGTR
jgi:OOP family OmpA-OmpF porin